MTFPIIRILRIIKVLPPSKKKKKKIFHVNPHCRILLLLIYLIIRDCLGFPVPSDKNGIQIWILPFKIYKIKYKIMCFHFINDNFTKNRYGYFRIINC